MNKEFVNYEIALALKELGYDKRCIAYYTADTKKLSLVQGYGGELMFADYVHLVNTVKSVPCPLKQQVFRWFREKYNKLATIYSNASGFLFEYHDTIGGTHRYSGIMGPNASGCWDTYEEAENACIDKLIEIAKQTRQ
jgi:hypothetical protein